MSERLNVDAALIQFRNAIRTEGASSAAGEALQRRALHDVGDFGDGGVRVNVDYFYALSATRTSRRVTGPAA